MKTLVLKSVLFSLLVMFSACGSNNLEAYKTQCLDAMAKEMNTTKEFLMRDLDVVIDSMEIIPITVSDSISILESFSKFVENGGVAEMESHIEQFNEVEGWARFIGGKQYEMYKEAKGFVDEFLEFLSNSEKLIKHDLPSYKDMAKDKVLAEVFTYQYAAKDSESGIHKVSKKQALFSSNGQLINLKCPIILAFYLKDKLGFFEGLPK